MKINKLVPFISMVFIVIMASTIVYADTTSDSQVQLEKEKKQVLTPGVDYPRIDIKYLTNPDTIGLTAKWKNDNLAPIADKLFTGENVRSDNISVFKDLSRMSLGIDLDLTASKDYHPSEGSKFGIKGVYNWWLGSDPVKQKFQDINGNDVIITIYRPYPGSVNLDFGGEAAPDKSGNDGQSWKFKDYNLGVTVNQQIPKTDIDIIDIIFSRNPKTNNLGKIPVVTSAYYKRVFQTSPTTTSYNREGISFDWGIPIIGSLGSYSSYIYPHTEWTWNADNSARNFTSVELDIFVNGIDKYISWLKSATPVIFTRYENGYKAPTFNHINSWNVGVGSTIIW